MAMMGARVAKRMNMPCAVAVPMPVGKGTRRRSIGPPVMHAWPGLKPATDPRVPVVHVRVAVVPMPMRMPRRARDHRPVPVAAMVMARRMDERRGVGMRDREKREEGSEREPRGPIPAPVPLMMPSSRLGAARDGEGRGERKGRDANHRPGASKTISGRAPKVARDVHHTLPHPDFAHCGLLDARVKPALPRWRRGG
ncbi:MAG: hypothetical protein OXC01_11570 [Immundisolibacterales bacterium]|nr:hypothetical protein [Immundisolibacterales bacterium]